MLMSQGCPANQTLTCSSGILFCVMASSYKIKLLNDFFQSEGRLFAVLHLFCVSISSTDFALTGLEENMVGKQCRLQFHDC